MAAGIKTDADRCGERGGSGRTGPRRRRRHAADRVHPPAPPSAAAASSPAKKAKHATPPRLPHKPYPDPPPRPDGHYCPARDRPPRDPSSFVALSWNVAGLNGLLKKDPDAIANLVAAEGADALCLQEHKLQASNVSATAPRLGLPGWHITWATSGERKGYSGVAIASRLPPVSVRVGLGDADHDDEVGGGGDGGAGWCGAVRGRV